MGAAAHHANCITLYCGDNSKFELVADVEMSCFVLLKQQLHNMECFLKYFRHGKMR
jgi:hypothetical protein